MTRPSVQVFNWPEGRSNLSDTISNRLSHSRCVARKGGRISSCGADLGLHSSLSRPCRPRQPVLVACPNLSGTIPNRLSHSRCVTRKGGRISSCGGDLGLHSSLSRPCRPRQPVRILLDFAICMFFKRARTDTSATTLHNRLNF